MLPRMVCLFAGTVALLVLLSFPLNAATLSDTGVSLCYDTQGNTINCPAQGQDFFGQDANYTGTPMDFVDNGNGTVTDRVTGLLWEQAADETERTWQEAAAYCASMGQGGNGAWRLPTAKELASITDYSLYGPSLNGIFSGDSTGYHWTSVDSADNADYAWVVSAWNGQVTTAQKTGTENVRCVSGTSEQSSYSDNNDGTVSDATYKLTWQQSYERGINWKDALNYCETLELANHTDWRMPNARELNSLVDYSRYRNAIDPLFNSIDNAYWTSTTDPLEHHTAKCFNFTDGYLGHYDKSGSYYVRCVRDGEGNGNAGSISSHINLLLLKDGP